MSACLPRESLEYVLFPITTSPVDPATLSHEVALVGEFEYPEALDWIAASYIDDQVAVLVRASTDAPAGGDITLAIGRWRIWWRALASPEFPVRQVGIVSVV